jgi:hypothetical protein
MQERALPSQTEKTETEEPRCINKNKHTKKLVSVKAEN